MAENRGGQVVTFYSYKGGTGRTMAMANVAWILAASGRRVLAVDWDLESPGLHRYFHPFLSEQAVRDRPGVIDMIREFDTASRRAAGRIADAAPYARVRQFAMSLAWQFPSGGGLDFVSRGRDASDYGTTIGALPWEDFYDKLGGAALFDALRNDMKEKYDFAFIDSRTGAGDIADICTVHLPDVFVNCFTLNIQGVEGAVEAAARVRRFSSLHGRRIRSLPVPMRVENSERVKLDAGRATARSRLGELVEAVPHGQRPGYWLNAEIPYQAYYAYEETLAAFGDAGPGPNSLLGAYQRLAGYIVGDGGEVKLAPLDVQTRAFWLERFERRVPVEPAVVSLDYEPEDEVWAEWTERVLTEAGVSVRRAEEQPPGAVPAAAPETVLTLAVVSPAYAGARGGGSAPPPRAPGTAAKAVYVSDMQHIEAFPAAASARLADERPEEAVRKLIRLAGCSQLPDTKVADLAEYFPLGKARISNLPVRDTLFTGRAEALRTLRSEIRKHGRAVVLPLLGLGGVGKTQIALEYAHRYESQYQVIWWVDCGQPEFVDTAMADLGARLRREYGIALAAEGASVPEAARAVVRLLQEGGVPGRCLLVFDNAEDRDAVLPFVPKSGAHVVVTSRDRVWSGDGKSLDVDVFDRRESVRHLLERVKDLDAQDAALIAEALGDLPLAIAAAGAWLKSSGQSARDYLAELEERGALSSLDAERPPGNYPRRLAAAWDPSLDRLADTAPAAYHLLELCSVLSPEGIGLALLQSPPMIGLLARSGPSLTGRGDVARQVHTLNQLALVTLNSASNELRVHRLLQESVRSRMTREHLEATRHEVHLLLASQRPQQDVDDPGAWDQYRLLWNHLLPSRAERCWDEAVRDLLVDRVRYVWIRGALAEAAALAERIDAIWQATLDEKPDDRPEQEERALRLQLLHLRFNLGNILRERGEVERAWRLDAQVLEQQTRLLASSHHHTLLTAGSLAADLRMLGRYGEALELAESTYGAWVENFGDGYPQTLSAANNVAVSLRLVGRYREAYTLDEDTYDRRITVLEPLHPRTLLSANFVGRDLREIGRYQDSVDWLERLLQEIGDEPGVDERAVGQIHANLGSSLRAAGRPEEADVSFGAALERIEAALDPGHTDLLLCRLGRASNLRALRRLAEAEKETRAVIAAFELRLGPDNPITLVCLGSLVATLRTMQRTEEALPIARRAARDLDAALGGRHPYTLAAETNLAVCLADAGELDEAFALCDGAARTLRTLMGADHADTLRSEGNAALIAVLRGDDGAQRRLDDVIDRLVSVLGGNHPSVAALRRRALIHRVLDPQPV